MLLICYENITAVGFVQLYSSFSSVSMKSICILNDIFIDELNRRKGYAQALISSACKYAHGQGIDTLKLQTQHTNTAAQEFYKKLGWELDTKFRTYSKQL